MKKSQSLRTMSPRATLPLWQEQLSMKGSFQVDRAAPHPTHCYESEYYALELTWPSRRTAQLWRQVRVV